MIFITSKFHDGSTVLLCLFTVCTGTGECLHFTESHLNEAIETSSTHSFQNAFVIPQSLEMFYQNLVETKSGIEEHIHPLPNLKKV